MSERRQGQILLVESDPSLGRGIADQLRADGYAVQLACSAEHARVLACRRAPCLALLGLLDGSRGALGLLEEIRHAGHDQPWDSALPAIVLGTHARQLDMLRAFEAGADDFLPRAARYLELRARLRAILRRTTASTRESSLEVGALEVDTRAHTASIHGCRLELRPLEFELLAQLAREPDRVFAKDELLRTIWGYRASGSTRTVDSHASRLRRKLDPGRSGVWIVNVWGVGYRLT